MLPANHCVDEIERRLSAETGGQGALSAAVRYALSAAAKRVRPVMTALSAQMFAPLDDCHWNAALAIELFHNFTLTHDDIMDNAPLRRRQPTLAKQFGVNTAILAGDLLLIKAYQCLRRLPDPRRVQKIFDHAAIAVCEGQQMDIDFECLEEISVEQYFDMTGKKTATLIGASCAVGAEAACANDAAALMYGFGYNLGIAFQLQDDYLDAYGSEAAFGKTIGGDIVQGKKTCLFAFACRSLPARRRRQFLDAFALPNTKDAQKVRRVMDFYGEADAGRQVLDAAGEYFEKSMLLLRNVQADLPAKQELERFARKLLGRDK